MGSAAAAAEQAAAFGMRAPELWNPVNSPRPIRAISVWDPTPELRPKRCPGSIRVDASRAAHGWIREAVSACRRGILDALVTAPISKEGFARAGIDVPGHTELLAELTRTRRFGMMLIGGNLRVVLVTRHVPLHRVPKLLTRPRLREAIELTHEALPWLGASSRRIAVCGLNPHAGDGGTIGREEKTTIAPVIRALQRKGLDVIGPVPADTVFHQAIHGAFDAVVAMYHDQGLAPLKMLAFDEGVNVTLGLPIVRTSPDHGTAFEIAGKGVAREHSMVEAIRTARRLALQPNPWVRGSSGRRA